MLHIRHPEAVKTTNFRIGILVAPAGKDARVRAPGTILEMKTVLEACSLNHLSTTLKNRSSMKATLRIEPSARFRLILTPR
jgi:hypothetical protein